MTVQALKFFRRNARGELCFLFRTFEGSSVVPLDRWIRTKRRWVREAQGRKYRAGFHFLREPERAQKFQKLTKGKYEMRSVLVRNPIPKPYSSVGSWLATEIFVSSVERL